MLRQILSPSSPECGGEPVGASISVDQLASSSSSSRGCYSNNVGALLTTNLDNNMRRDYTSPSFESVEMFSSGSSSYPCPTCGMEFVSRFKLNYHTRTHMERKFGCNVCGKSFTTQHHLKMHEAMHSDVKPFTCRTCPATFRYQKLLDRHRKMHDDPDVVKPYSCPRCFMRFDTRNNYNHHAKTHKSNALNAPNTDGERLNDNFNQVLPPVSVTNSTSLSQTSFPCEACSLEFPSIDSLTTHKLVHRSRPLVCDVCGKGFTHRKYYVVHQRIHTGERPYLCAMCGKSFTQASTLTVHRRYHTGERPYTCTQCGKGFVTRTIMLNHMKKH